MITKSILMPSGETFSYQLYPGRPVKNHQGALFFTYADDLAVTLVHGNIRSFADYVRGVDDG